MTEITYDASRLQPMTVQGGIDFLQVEEQYGGGSAGGFGGGATLTPSRNWTDDLCYGTGTTYLAGLTLGGAYGMVEGVRKSRQGPQNFKVRLNTTLNTITRRGPGLGNAVGVLAMTYNGATALIDYSRGKHDIFNSVAGGALAGAIFKSTAGKTQFLRFYTRGLERVLIFLGNVLGPRAAAISSGVCATVAGVWSLAMSALYDKK